VTLGTIEKLTPTEAREAARKLLARVALGQDPQHEREVQRAQEERTFRAAIEAYLAAKRPELRPISYRIAKLYLDGAYFRPLHPLAVNTITHPDIAARLSAIAHKHSAHTSAAARRHLSAAFRWFMEEGWTSVNPVIGARKPADPKPRDFVLTNTELVHIWNAAGDDDFGRILKLLLLLGSRRQEVGGMRWTELDLETGT
jgi:integrase